ncbi:hypothetical protein K461DRAFT_324973 [Myriangium duriaei CBS 260.36]|uniref:2EXR domain-containing protein n=1 Tax=Myriangium duriaei CBS 260.36 TaxID=1168546 RepID=A0A9P4IT29_9PEZI|nr:hypothetical protein K461DRAFT_324973 [Myriangium duriaei CBS 260.36]
MAFQAFLDLPTEVRLEIWALCLPHTSTCRPRLTPYDSTCWAETNIIEADGRSHRRLNYDHTRLAHTPMYLPSVLVNKEAYSVARPWLTSRHIRWQPNIQFSVPFDPHKDALFLSKDVFSELHAEAKRSQWGRNPDILLQVARRCEVKHVAVDRETEQHFYGDSIMETVRTQFPGVRTVLIVMGEEGEVGKQGTTWERMGTEVVDWGWRDARGSGLRWNEETGGWYWGLGDEKGKKINENLATFLFSLRYAELDFSESSLREVKAVVAVRR